MALARRKSVEYRRLEFQPHAWRDDVKTVLFIDRVTEHDSPVAVPFLENVVIAPRTGRVAENPVDTGLGSKHDSRLRNGLQLR